MFVVGPNVFSREAWIPTSGFRTRGALHVRFLVALVPILADGSIVHG